MITCAAKGESATKAVFGILPTLFHECSTQMLYFNDMYQRYNHDRQGADAGNIRQNSVRKAKGWQNNRKRMVRLYYARFKENVSMNFS